MQIIVSNVYLRKKNIYNDSSPIFYSYNPMKGSFKKIKDQTD